MRRCPYGDDDPETGECLRRLTRCSCNPPRCICGRFVSDWNDMHPECRERMVDEMAADERADFEAGLL